MLMASGVHGGAFATVRADDNHAACNVGRLAAAAAATAHATRRVARALRVGKRVLVHAA